MIISGNGYTLRPLAYADKAFVVESMLDFPIAPSVQMAENSFANMLNLTNGFQDARIGTADQPAICLVLERGGAALSFRLTKFYMSIAELAMLARHPDARGKGHQDADSFLHGWWYFEHMSCLSCWFEAKDRPDTNGAAQKWRDGTAYPRGDTRKCKWDDEMLEKTILTRDEFLALRRADPVWSGVTFSVAP